MNKKTELIYAISSLLTAANNRKPIPEEIPDRLEAMETLEDLNFDALLQGIRFNAETVFAYKAEGDYDSSCNYCGLELFPCRATLIDSLCVEEEQDIVHLSRSLELWLLDNFSFALVACTEIEYAEGTYNTAYRVVRATDLDEIAEEMVLLLGSLADRLVELADSFWEPGTPTFEL